MPSRMLSPKPHNISFRKAVCYLNDGIVNSIRYHNGDSACMLQKNGAPIKLSSLGFVLKKVSLQWRASLTLFKQQLSDKNEKVSDFSISTTAHSDVC